jgi:AcrR family transcriptional regulator
LFAQKGFHTTTIADIAKHAGIAKGLVYNYFTSKEDLLYFTLVDGFNKLLHDFDVDHDGNLTSAEMKHYINSLFNAMAKDKHYWKLFFSVTLQPEVFDMAIIEKLMEVVNPFFAILERYFEAKGFDNPQVEVIYFHSLLDGILMNVIFNDEYPIDLIKELVIKRYT